MTWSNAEKGPISWLRRWPSIAALVLLALAGWLLVALAQAGGFIWWPVTLVLLALAALAAVLALWLATWFDRLAVLVLAGVTILLYTPPSQQIALSGDAAIYPNEGAFIARTGGVSEIYEPFTALSPAARDLFYVGSDEQFDGKYAVQSYQGLLYGGYYVTDAEQARIHTSRMPLAEVWLALLSTLLNLEAAFFLNAAYALLALVLLYAIGVQINGRRLALWSALLLAVSYPQVHFSRAPYAEIVGQAWMLAGLLLAVLWLRQRQAWQVVLALFFWVTTWSARVDGLLLLGAASLLLLVAAHDRDRASLRAGLLALPTIFLLGWLGNNPPYVGATVELFGNLFLLFIPALIALLVGLPLALLLAWHWGQPFTSTVWPRVAQPVRVVIFAACAFVVLWATLPNPLREAGVTRRYQEIIWFSSAYITPLFYWLALAGVGVILWRRADRVRLFILATFLGLAAIFFYRYSSAPVYPVSLRRLIADVYPLMALLAGAALAAIPWRDQWRIVRVVVAIVAVLWIGWLALPVIEQHEAADDLAFVEQLHAALPANGVFLFERQDGDSWVGWLAAPLYSIYNDWAVLLESDEPDAAVLGVAVGEFEAAGRTVYVISQHDPLPEPLLPAGYTAQKVNQFAWRSSLIGQTRDPVYPPPYWEFEHPLNIYQLRAQSAP